MCVAQTMQMVISAAEVAARTIWWAMCAVDKAQMMRLVMYVKVMVPMMQWVMCGARIMRMAMSVVEIGISKTRFNGVSAVENSILTP
jgi:hypothetical protein